MTKYALLSVFNKTNIEHLARFLVSKDYNLLSSGGTAKFLASNNIPVTEVSDFTKSPEFTDPTDPSKGTTGNTIFTINERFTSIESIQRHVENASQNDYFPEFYEIMGNYGKVIGIGGEVLHSIR